MKKLLIARAIYLNSTPTDDENSNRTVGLSRIITVKVGARVMIRRNIDVTIGLVIGSIGTIVSVSRAIDIVMTLIQ